MANKYYAVKAGKKPGIYTTWNDCKEQVNGYSGAVYKSFKTESEAEAFIGITNSNTEPKVNTETAVISSNARLTAYTDGSWHPQTPEYFGYGFVLFNDDNPENITTKHGLVTDDPDMAKMRNVAGEITAVISAVNTARELHATELTVYHDYQGIEKWANNSWKAKNQYTQNYKTFIQKMRESMTINFIHVQSHTGDKYNELADELANTGFKGLI